MQVFEEPTYFAKPTDIKHSSGTIHVGAFTVIEASKASPLIFVGTAEIGHQCYFSFNEHITEPTKIENGVIVDSQCRIAGGSKLGEKTQILYGATIFESVEIGDECIVGSDVSNWAKIGDRVTFMGTIAHSNRKVGRLEEWNTDPHPAPRIGSGAFVGEAAILVGGIEIGEFSYIAAGEVVRSNVPSNSVFMKGRVHPISRFRNFIST